MKIDKEIISLLAQCQTEGNTLRITQQLERKTYTQLNKVLTAIGGKWNAPKKVHIFPEEVEEIIENIINTGQYSCLKKDFQYFPTPTPLAQQIVTMANIQPTDSCLEPSAGTGNIAQLMPHCDCIELNENNRKTLQQKGLHVIHNDFLTFTPAKDYDVIVMNPPFSKGQDIAHITKAIHIAKKCVIAIASGAVLFKTDSKTQAFRQLISQYGGTIEPLPAESFKESGTMVNTVLIKIFKNLLNTI